MAKKKKQLSKAAEEIARQERQRKHRESVYYNSSYTAEDEQMLQIYTRHLSNMRQLIKFRMKYFNDRGQILVKDDQSVEEYVSGKTFLEDLIVYFEQEDESYAYLYCAKLKVLLDAYNEKFKC